MVKKLNCRKTILDNPITTFSIILIFSAILLFIENIYIVLIFFIISLAISMFLMGRNSITIISTTLTIIFIYTILALIIQIIVVSSIIVNIAMLNFFRFGSIAIFSLSLATCVNIAKLISYLRRISPRLGCALALSIKMMKNFSRTWVTIYKVYSVNVGWRGYLDRIKLFLLCVKVFTFVVMYTATQNAEVLLTRTKIFRSNTFSITNFEALRY